MPRRLRYLDEPLLAQRLYVKTAHEAVRQLATDEALSTAMRNRCARMALALAHMARTLAAQAELDGGPHP